MEETKLIAKNPNARHNYDIKNTIEAGIELTGTEIKSIRNGKINLKDSYAVIIIKILLELENYCCIERK